MGSGNPPDKPGYKVVTLDSNDTVASQQLNDLADQGYEFLDLSGSRVILGNYKKDS
jgi:hypothetical protein